MARSFEQDILFNVFRVKPVYFMLESCLTPPYELIRT